MPAEWQGIIWQSALGFAQRNRQRQSLCRRHSEAEALIENFRFRQHREFSRKAPKRQWPSLPSVQGRTISKLHDCKAAQLPSCMSAVDHSSLTGAQMQQGKRAQLPDCTLGGEGHEGCGDHDQ
jgi:hypothetical protein